MYIAKRNIVATVVILLICLNISVRTVFAQNASLNVEPATATIDIDEELTVNITIKDLPDPPALFGYELVLHFDKNYLEAISADPEPEGHFLTPTTGVPPGIFIVYPGTIDNELGTVAFAVTLLAPEVGRSGSGLLCSVTFRGKAEGLALLTLEDVVLADYPLAHEIPEEDYDINDSEITVIPEFSAIAMMLLLLAATAMILFLRKKSLLEIKI